MRNTETPVAIILPSLADVSSLLAKCLGSHFTWCLRDGVASLRFQPTKRPQLSNAKLKSKLPSSKVPLAASTPGALKDEQISDPAAISKATTTKSTLADWTAGADGNNVNDFYQSEKRQRGGKKRRKKNREEAAVIHNWDDIYDPTRPNNYEDYYNSDEKIAEIKEWKDRLYAHRTARRHSSHSGSSCQGDDKDQINSRKSILTLSYISES